MKKYKHLLFCFCIGFLPISSIAQNDTLNLLFRNSYSTFDVMRNELGIYRDSKLFFGSDYHPSSVASIGMGLVSLCIADAMNWINDAEDRALLTLKSIAGETPGFFPDRNISGFFKHWIDMNTGESPSDWTSEYSTIDSGILMAGALFCKKYFCANNEIQTYVDTLWNSIDWSKAIQNPETGGIYLAMQPNGEGINGSVTLPFNEYMIVAWLAMNQEGNNLGNATQLWNNFYADAHDLMTRDYQGISVLTDSPNHYLSSFVIQFPYYLCHYFTENSTYLDFLSKARQTDSLWWANHPNALPHQWGLGAGSANFGFGYHACSVNNNPTAIYSPHIIGGFIPVYPEGAQDLLQLYREGSSSYNLPGVVGGKILWRRSLDEPAWNANEVQGVDYSTMLFGLASLPEFLGAAFFPTYNDFFSGPCATTSSEEKILNNNYFKIFPNPTSSSLSFSIKQNLRGPLKISIRDAHGRIIRITQEEKHTKYFEKEIDLHTLNPGVYYIELQMEKWIAMKKFIILL